MNSSSLPYLVREEEEHRVQTAIEALQNLIYLIREDAGYPERINAYADQADKLLRKIQTHLS